MGNVHSSGRQAVEKKMLAEMHKPRMRPVADNCKVFPLGGQIQFKICNKWRDNCRGNMIFMANRLIYLLLLGGWFYQLGFVLSVDTLTREDRTNSPTWISNGRVTWESFGCNSKNGLVASDMTFLLLLAAGDRDRQTLSNYENSMCLLGKWYTCPEEPFLL